HYRVLFLLGRGRGMEVPALHGSHRRPGRGSHWGIEEACGHGAYYATAAADPAGDAAHDAAEDAAGVPANHAADVPANGDAVGHHRYLDRIRRRANAQHRGEHRPVT